jgi:CRISP-associated protein Cas1
MAEEPIVLPLRMTNEFVYCPLLYWLEYVGREFAHSPETLDGQRVHRNVDRPASGPLPDRDEEFAATRSVTLSSESLGIVGTLDIGETDGGEACPVDYKRGKVQVHQ